MLHLYLVRHGQKRIDELDPRLTELGQHQAEIVGKYLTQFPITHIIASPYRRTQETAQTIAKQLNLAIQTDSRLVERMELEDLGEFETFIKAWLQATHDRTFQPYTGDSSEATGLRVKAVVDEIAEKKDLHIVLVTHGGAIVDFLRTVVGDEAVASLEREFDFGRDYAIQECSVTQVTKDGDEYQITDLHNITHLA